MYVPRKAPNAVGLAATAVLDVGCVALAYNFLTEPGIGPMGRVFGAACAGLALLLIGYVINAFAESRFPRGLPRPRNRVTGGVPTTLVPHWPWGPWLILASLALIASTAIGWAWLDVRDPGPAGIAWILFPAGVFFAGPVVFALLGRWRAGSLELTGEGLIDHVASVRTQVRWDEVGRVVASDGTVGLESPRSHMKQTVPWLRERLPGGNEAFIQAVTLGVPAPMLAAALSHWATHPSDRAELGTEAALRRLRGEAG